MHAMKRPFIALLVGAIAASSASVCRRANGTFDFVIVGLGAAGSITAARLAERGQTVAGLEAGPPLQGVNGGELVWGTTLDGLHTKITVFDVPGLASLPPAPQNLYWDVGKHTRGIGGDGAHNGMLYLRGSKEDFDVKLNISDWSYNDVLPYYKRTENDQGKGRGEQHRGSSGKITITDAVPSKWDLKLLSACRDAGYPSTNDFNAPDGRLGCGVVQMSINQHGVRASSSSTYLPPSAASSSSQLLLQSPNTLATRIIFEASEAGKQRAVGVQVRESCEGNNYSYTVKASKGVVLAGGTHNTPRLLLLSGIGPAAELRNLSLPVVADLCVGCTLFNHLTVALQFDTSEAWPFTDPKASTWSICDMALATGTAPLVVAKDQC